MEKKKSTYSGRIIVLVITLFVLIVFIARMLPVSKMEQDIATSSEDEVSEDNLVDWHDKLDANDPGCTKYAYGQVLDYYYNDFEIDKDELKEWAGKYDVESTMQGDGTYGISYELSFFEYDINEDEVNELFIAISPLATDRNFNIIGIYAVKDSTSMDATELITAGVLERIEVFKERVGKRDAANNWKIYKISSADRLELTSTSEDKNALWKSIFNQSQERKRIVARTVNVSDGESKSASSEVTTAESNNDSSGSTLIGKEFDYDIEWFELRLDADDSEYNTQAYNKVIGYYYSDFEIDKETLKEWARRYDVETHIMDDGSYYINYDLSFCERDINGDGINELLIAMSSLNGEADYNIIGIYTVSSSETTQATELITVDILDKLEVFGDKVAMTGDSVNWKMYEMTFEDEKARLKSLGEESKNMEDGTFYLYRAWDSINMKAVKYE